MATITVDTVRMVAFLHAATDADLWVLSTLGGEVMVGPAAYGVVTPLADSWHDQWIAATPAQRAQLEPFRMRRATVAERAYG